MDTLKKLNSLPQFAMLWNQEYWFTISKYQKRLAENEKKKNTCNYKVLCISRKRNKNSLEHEWNACRS